MNDPNSPDIQAIFAQLHALGVTPEQAAHGLTMLRFGHLFGAGDTATLARAVEVDSRGNNSHWPYKWGAHLGEVVTIERVDYENTDGMEVLVELECGERAWVSHEALDHVEPTA